MGGGVLRGVILCAAITSTAAFGADTSPDGTTLVVAETELVAGEVDLTGDWAKLFPSNPGASAVTLAVGTTRYELTAKKVTRQMCPELFRLAPSGKASLTAAAAGADRTVTVTLRGPDATPSDALFDVASTKLWMEDHRAATTCSVLADVWTDCTSLTAAGAAEDNRSPYTLGGGNDAIAAALDGSDTSTVVLRTVRSDTNEVVQRAVKRKSKVPPTGPAGQWDCTSDIAKTSFTDPGTQWICIDQADPKVKGRMTRYRGPNSAAQPHPVLLSNHRLVVLVRSRYKASLTVTVDGEKGTAGLFVEGDALDAGLVVDPPEPDFQVDVQDFDSFKPGELTVKVAVKGYPAADSSHEQTYKVTVDREVLGAIRMGMSVSYLFDRPGFPLSRYEARTPQGSTTKAIADKGRDEWVTSELVAGVSFFLRGKNNRVRASRLDRPIPAWYLGLGIIDFDASKGNAFVPSLHTGPEISLGANTALALTGSLQFEEALAKGIEPGQPTDSDTLDTRIVPVMGVGLVLSVTPNAFKLFTGGN